MPFRQKMTIYLAAISSDYFTSMGILREHCFFPPVRHPIKEEAETKQNGADKVKITKNRAKLINFSYNGLLFKCSSSMASLLPDQSLHDLLVHWLARWGKRERESHLRMKRRFLKLDSRQSVSFSILTKADIFVSFRRTVISYDSHCALNLLIPNVLLIPMTDGRCFDHSLISSHFFITS